MIISITALVLTVACYAISQLQQHGQLKWQRGRFTFWGYASDKRKFKNLDSAHGPAFIGSTTWLVWLTDGYHFMQFLALKFFALSMAFHVSWAAWYIELAAYIALIQLSFYLFYSKLFHK